MNDLDDLISKILLPHIDKITHYITDGILDQVISLICDEVKFYGDQNELKNKIVDKIQKNVEQAKKANGDKL